MGVQQRLDGEQLRAGVERHELHLRRYLQRKGRSHDYRVDQVRRLHYIAREGFPLEAFRRSTGPAAQDLVVDWIISFEDRRRGEGRPLSDCGHDNIVKLVNLLARVHGVAMDRLSYRVKGRQLRRVALKPEQVRHAIDAYQHPEAGVETRNRALFVFALLTAMRRGELSRLDLQDLDVDAGLVRVARSSKNAVSSWIPVPSDLWPFIEEWLAVRPDPGSQALWTTIRSPVRRLAPAGVYQVLRGVGKRTGLHLNATVTRHTRNRSLKRAGWPADVRRFVLRHQDERALAFYDETDLEDVLDVVQERGDPGLGAPAPRAPCPTCGRG